MPHLSLFSHLPAGAVPAGTAVTFALRPLRAEGFSNAQLTLSYEQDGGREEHLSLPWSGREGIYDVFSTAPSSPDWTGESTPKVRSKSRSMTPVKPSRLGLGKALPIRFSPTVFSVPAPLTRLE